MTSSVPKPIYNLFSTEPSGADLRDWGPLHTCICGSDLWHTLMRFEDNAPAFYFLEMLCVSCGALATAPTEID